MTVCTPPAPAGTRILESRPHPEQGYRAVLGIMRLGRRHGNARLDAASARALALGSCRFHTVKNILAAGPPGSYWHRVREQGVGRSDFEHTLARPAGRRLAD